MLALRLDPREHRQRHHARREQSGAPGQGNPPGPGACSTPKSIRVTPTASVTPPATSSGSASGARDSIMRVATRKNAISRQRDVDREDRPPPEVHRQEGAEQRARPGLRIPRRRRRAPGCARAPRASTGPPRRSSATGTSPAAPRPWSARAAISCGIERAKAHVTAPVRKTRDRDEHQAAPSVDVREAAVDGHRHRRGQQVDREDPRVERKAAQVADDRRHRRRDDGGLEGGERRHEHEGQPSRRGAASGSKRGRGRLRHERESLQQGSTGLSSALASRDDETDSRPGVSLRDSPAGGSGAGPGRPRGGPVAVGSSRRDGVRTRGPVREGVGRDVLRGPERRPRDRAIVDLALAPANAKGEVEFSADFFVIRPKDPARGSGTLLLGGAQPRRQRDPRADEPGARLDGSRDGGGAGRRVPRCGAARPWRGSAGNGTCATFPGACASRRPSPGRTGNRSPGSSARTSSWTLRLLRILSAMSSPATSAARATPRPNRTTRRTS